MNENFNHVNYCKNKTYAISILNDLGVIKNKLELKSMLIQCMMQRVDKLAKKILIILIHLVKITN